MHLSYGTKRVLDILNTIIDWFLAIILLINLYNLAMRNIRHIDMPMLGGWGYAVVVSGSMEPAISVNDVVFIKAQPSYGRGDVITFIDQDSPSKALVTHRIARVEKDGFVTKGDANNTEDHGFVKLSDVQGKVRYVLPYVGATLLIAQTPRGVLLLILLALLFIELPYRIRTRYKKASPERIEEIKDKLTGGKEVKKFTPDLYMEENDGTYKAPEKTKKQKDFEKELDRRWHKKMKYKVYVPDEKHWDISLDDNSKK